MNKDELIKWALIAVGGYLVWEYVIKPMLNTTPTVAAPAPAQTSSPAAQTAAPGAPTQPQPSPQSQPQQPVATGTFISNDPAYPPWMASLPALAAQMVGVIGADNQPVLTWNTAYDMLRLSRQQAPLTTDQVAQLVNYLTPGGNNVAEVTIVNPLTGQPMTVAPNAPTVTAMQYVNAVAGLGMGLQGLGGVGEIVNLQPRKMSMSFGGGMGAASRLRGFAGKGLVH